MTKEWHHKTFTVNEHLTIHCHGEDTRYGFRHLATLHRDGWSAAQAKVCYYNRTWERYEFQSVIRELSRKVAAPEREIIYEFAEKYQEAPDSLFNSIAAICKLGEVLCSGQKEKNDWKTRMIKAGLGNRGLEIPDDWETLSEDEKETRLNNVIKELTV